MWYLQECEHALYLPSIFSWLASLATLSRLLRNFSSGSAIFPLNLCPLVLSFSSCPPFPSSLYVPFLLLPGFPLSVPLPTPPQLTLNLSQTLPDSSSLTHSRAHSPLHAHTAFVTQTRIYLTLILSPSLPPSPGYSGRSWTFVMLLPAWAYTHSKWTMGYLRGGGVGYWQAPFGGANMWRCNLFVRCLIQYYTVCQRVSVCAFVCVGCCKSIAPSSGINMEYQVSLFSVTQKGDTTQKMETHWPTSVETIQINNDEAHDVSVSRDAFSTIVIHAIPCVYTVFKLNRNITSLQCQCAHAAP